MESISRISSLLETARDLTLEAARDAGPRKTRAAGSGASSSGTSRSIMPAAQIKKLLDSRSERDLLEGLRKVIAMQYAHPPQPTLSFFPAVLKTLSHQYPSTRPLVYSYLLHHAEADPDTALLAVNTIQKSLGDSNPRVRAMALKTMSAIRVPVLSQIISLAIKRGVGDLSPLVRKAAALASVKCVRLDATTQPQIEEFLATLLLDKQYFVAGAAVQAFMEVCPERLDLIHPAYRKLCKMIVDMDEWGQLATLRLMTFYARKNFPRRVRKVRRSGRTGDRQSSAEDRARDFYEDLEPEEETQPGAEEYEEVAALDPDLELFLEAAKPLLQSRNSAVILSVTKAYLYLSPATHLPLAVGPLIALLRSPQDIQTVAYHNIVQIALLQPSLFVPYTRHFILRSTDTPTTRSLKLELLTLIFPHSPSQTQDLLLAELENFSQQTSNPSLVRESVRAIGRCAQNCSDGQTSRRCLSLLLRQIHSADANLVGEAIEVVRLLILRNPDEHSKTIVRLAKNLDTLVSPAARASVVWLVGEFAAADGEDGSDAGSGSIAADVLRLMLPGYAEEDEAVKSQIVLLAAKVYLHFLNSRKAKKSNSSNNPFLPGEATAETHADEQAKPEDADSSPSDTDSAIPKLYAHALLLARYTPSYDLRDRARLYRNLLGSGSIAESEIEPNTDLASLLLLAPKPVPLAPSPGEARKGFLLGSASLVVGAKASMTRNQEVPEWVVEGEEPDARSRDVGGSDESSFATGGEARGFGASSAAAGRGVEDAVRGDEGLDRVIAIGKGGAGSRKQKTLDDWLDEEDEESSEEEEDSEEESDEEESSSGKEYEDDESEEEDDDDDEEDENARLV